MSSTYRTAACSAMLLLLLLPQLLLTTEAFVSPRPISQVTRTHATPSAQTAVSLVQTGPSRALISDAGPDDAFTDSISLLDGPILTMVGVFAVFIVGLVAFKALSDRMDSAIENVLVDFEATLTRFFPQQWQVMEKELEGLEGEDRQRKLLQMMDELEIEDRDFLEKVKEKMTTM